ncbi:uncharacterized protein TNCT_270641 [Trichonephila clavata]|uniref:Gustatory receptor n=1 Tax=Trichonephila clavata TaxID=2740835 RepID=A0A8X6HHT4_TRICU|nr:uncharacterized protein TNCT_270641 [Trichonephila clavata]
MKGNEMKSNIPCFISIFVWCTGLVQGSEGRLKAWPLVSLVLLFSTVDFAVVIIANFDTTGLKISLTLLLALTLASVMHFLMSRMKRRLSILLLKLQYLPPSTKERIFSLLMLVIFLIPVAVAMSVTILCDKKITSTAYAFGKEVENQWAQIMLIFFKEYIYFLTYPTFPCLISVLYCTICVRCSYAIRKLTLKISLCSPEQFGPSEQIQVLRYKEKIDEILKITQEIFSVPSFCFIVATSISCYSILGWYLICNAETIQLIEGSTVGVSSFLCLTVTLWTAGTLPVELNKLKDTFYEKTFSRWISFRFLSEENYRNEILNKPYFAFTGCDIISYTRNSVFAIVGALVTYTVLIISMPGI